MTIPDHFNPHHPAPTFDMQAALVADLVDHHGRAMTSTELHHATGIPFGTLGNPLFYYRLEHHHGITRHTPARRGRHRGAATFHPAPHPEARP
jgi:hypothetical protein